MPGGGLVLAGGGGAGGQVDDRGGLGGPADEGAVQGLRGGGGPVGAGGEDCRDPRHEVEVVGGLPGDQGVGQPPGGQCKLVGKFQGGHAVVLGEQGVLVTKGKAVRFALLPGAVRLGLAGA
ncbi:hypothetical protein [Streptomyces sp. NPDC059262]|uniref:hypothetical protein n=1 Tax=Streptomyces sp. NPDC059262 TaxID=3346797 RepID=UPI0036A3F3C9